MKEIIKIQVLSLSLWGFSSGSLAAEDKDFVAAMTKLGNKPGFLSAENFPPTGPKSGSGSGNLSGPRA